MELWILLAIASAVGWALVVLLDKFVVDTEMSDPKATGSLHAIFNCAAVLGVSFSLGGAISNVYIAASGMILGFLYVLANFFWFSGVGSEDVSRFAPVLSFDVVFIALLSFVFLQESFSAIVYGGMGLTVAGCVLISLENPLESLSEIESRWGLVAALTSALIYATREVVFKHFSAGTDVWSLLFYFGASGIAFSALMAYTARDEIAGNLEGSELMTLSGLVSGFSQVAFFLAVSLGSVSIVSTITKTRFLVIFFGATAISRIHPEIIHESLETRLLIQKLAATSMIILGVIVATSSM